MGIVIVVGGDVIVYRMIVLLMASMLCFCLVSTLCVCINMLHKECVLLFV